MAFRFGVKRNLLPSKERVGRNMPSGGGARSESPAVNRGVSTPVRKPTGRRQQNNGPTIPSTSNSYLSRFTPSDARGNTSALIPSEATASADSCSDWCVGDLPETLSEQENAELKRLREELCRIKQGRMSVADQIRQKQSELVSQHSAYLTISANISNIRVSADRVKASIDSLSRLYASAESDSSKTSLHTLTALRGALKSLEKEAEASVSKFLQERLRREPLISMIDSLIGCTKSFCILQTSEAENSAASNSNPSVDRSRQPSAIQVSYESNCIKMPALRRPFRSSSQGSGLSTTLDADAEPRQRPSGPPSSVEFTAVIDQYSIGHILQNLSFWNYISKRQNTLVLGIGGQKTGKTQALFGAPSQRPPGANSFLDKFLVELFADDIAELTKEAPSFSDANSTEETPPAFLSGIDSLARRKDQTVKMICLGVREGGIIDLASRETSNTVQIVKVDSCQRFNIVDSKVCTPFIVGAKRTTIASSADAHRLLADIGLEGLGKQSMAVLICFEVWRRETDDIRVAQGAGQFSGASRGGAAGPRQQKTNSPTKSLIGYMKSKGRKDNEAAYPESPVLICFCEAHAAVDVADFVHSSSCIGSFLSRALQCLFPALSQRDGAISETDSGLILASCCNVADVEETAKTLEVASLLPISKSISLKSVLSG